MSNDATTGAAALYLLLQRAEREQATQDAVNKAARALAEKLGQILCLVQERSGVPQSVEINDRTYTAMPGRGSYGGRTYILMVDGRAIEDLGNLRKSTEKAMTPSTFADRLALIDDENALESELDARLTAVVDPELVRAALTAAYYEEHLDVDAATQRATAEDVLVNRTQKIAAKISTPFINAARSATTETEKEKLRCRFVDGPPAADGEPAKPVHVIEVTPALYDKNWGVVLTIDGASLESLDDVTDGFTGGEASIEQRDLFVRNIGAVLRWISDLTVQTDSPGAADAAARATALANFLGVPPMGLLGLLMEGAQAFGAMIFGQAASQAGQAPDSPTTDATTSTMPALGEAPGSQGPSLG